MNPAEFVNIAHTERDFWWYAGMRRILFTLLDPLVQGRKIKSVLEAGCGTGYNASALREHYGWEMYALDLEMEGLRYARPLGLANLIQADIASLPFRSETFQAVVSLDVIVHFPLGEEGKPLAEFARVLAPGGLLVLRVAALDILRSRHSQFAHERQRFTAKRLVRAVTRAGVRVLRCTYANSVLLPVALAKFRVWEPLLRRPPQSGVLPVGRRLNRLLQVPLEAEDRWLSKGRNLPLGQSLILIGERQSHR